MRYAGLLDDERDNSIPGCDCLHMTFLLVESPGREWPRGVIGKLPETRRLDGKKISGHQGICNSKLPSRIAAGEDAKCNLISDRIVWGSAVTGASSRFAAEMATCVREADQGSRATPDCSEPYAGDGTEGGGCGEVWGGGMIGRKDSSHMWDLII